MPKSIEEKKADKAAYDREYRERNYVKANKSASFKKAYAANPEKYREQRKNRMPYHVEYCRSPEQREKERIRNRNKNGLTDLKLCISCNETKQKIEFESYPIFPDNRNYICKHCDKKSLEHNGINTRSILANIRTSLRKTKSKLTIRDISKYPYLIDTYKYIYLLNRETK